MATNINVGDTFEATAFVYDGVSQYAANVFHYQCIAKTGTGATDIDATTFMEGTLATAYKLMMAATSSWWGLRGQIIAPIRYVAEFIAASRGAGALAGDLLPTQVCGLLHCHGSRAGARYRGRAYLPFPVEGRNSIDAKPTAAQVADMAALGSIVYQDILINNGGGNTLTLQPQIRSKTYGTNEPVLVQGAETEWATQRRRAGRTRSDTPPQ